ncbi:uncharacterized protein LOC132193075 [Neocloeon triangulifer]|uniref:uncharacterized protein LOC132193075 n=1 Tax=Neocloeon triangulifer TaxID=2078957 RepID=UPI00286EDE60|nr:uncharacterized protein LOC132193075 [Neocloeon triangulifer]
MTSTALKHSNPIKQITTTDLQIHETSTSASGTDSVGITEVITDPSSQETSSAMIESSSVNSESTTNTADASTEPSTVETSTTTLPPLCNCPACVKQNVVSSGISFKDPETYGEWTSVDNITYLFGGSPMIWSNAWQKCCSYGMTLISFESLQKLKRVGEKLQNWPYNTRFWTSGTSKGCTSGSFVWCSSNNPQFDAGIWHANQPDEKNISAGVCVSTSLENGTFLLNDDFCSNRYAFACESAQMANPGELLQNGCPPNQNCGNNMIGLPTYNSDQLIYEPGPIRGTFSSSCGLTYYISRMKKSWADARNYCCSIGMDLASVNLIEKIDCLSQVFTKFPTRLNETSYWSSGRATKIPGKHYWCSTESYVYPQETVWAKDFPKNEHTCIVIAFNTAINSTELQTAFCEEEKPFICSASALSALVAQRMWYDCSTTYGLAKDEEDELLQFSLTLPVQRLMCYARCIAHYHHKIADTRINGPNILQVLEQLQLTPAELQGAYVGYEKCENTVLPMNYSRCLFTYMVARCALANGYLVMQKMLTFSTGSLRQFLPSTLPCDPNYQYCDTGLPCVQNAALIGQLKTTGKTDIGTLVSLPSGANYCIVKREVKFLYSSAYSYCCSIGMKLIEIDNMKKLDDLLQFDPTLRPLNLTVVGPLKEDENGEPSKWCSSGASIPLALFPQGKIPKDPCFKRTNCLFLNLNADNTLLYDNCEYTSVSFFVCEL